MRTNMSRSILISNIDIMNNFMAIWGITDPSNFCTYFYNTQSEIITIMKLIVITNQLYSVLWK